MTLDKTTRLSAADIADLNAKIAATTGLEDTPMLPSALAHSNGHVYAGIYSGGAVKLIAGFDYDLAAGAITALPALAKGDKMCRGAWVDAATGDVWFAIRSNFLGKITPGQKSVTEYETGISGKIEGGCCAGDKCYACGRSSGEGVVFELNASNAALQKIVYSPSTVVKYISKSAMAKI